jgi:hypothetical protein
MAKFLVKEQSFIDNKVVEAGAEIEYDGFPGPNLEPIDPEAKKLAEQAPSDQIAADRQKKAAGGDTNLPVIKPKK